MYKFYGCDEHEALAPETLKADNWDNRFTVILLDMLLVEKRP